MLLCLDIGNTNITAGVFDGETLRAQWRLSSARDRTADEFAAFFQVAFAAENLAFENISGVAISSVVPPLSPQATLLSTRYFHCEPLVVGPKTQTGLVNDYDNPREVGADRLVNALAAWKKFGTACLIVDFGTATTVDAVSADGHYLGGAIAPGLQISTDALFRAAARLPRVALEAPPRALAKNTAQSLQSGLVFGYAGLVKELIERCAPEVTNDDITIIATGGLAELIAPLVPRIQSVEPHLTLEGLRLIWHNERETRASTRA